MLIITCLAPMGGGLSGSASNAAAGTSSLTSGLFLILRLKVIFNNKNY